MTVTTSPDEQAIITALAGQSEPVEMAAFIHSALNPRPAPRPGKRYLDFRTREAKAWLDRDVELWTVFLSLWSRGTIVTTRDSDGENPPLFALAAGAMAGRS